MKKVSFILLSLLILSISVNAQFAFSSTKIMLTQKDGDRDISGQEGDITPENAPKARSSVSQPICASLYNKVVTIDFQTVFSTVTVNTTNETLLSTGNCKIINLSEENILWGFKI